MRNTGTEVLNVAKKNVSVKMDESLIKTIDRYAQSRRMSRSEAMVSMLNNVQIILIHEGAEIMMLLHSLDGLLKNNRISHEDKEKIKGVCEGIWQLLNLITEKSHLPKEEQEN